MREVKVDRPLFIVGSGRSGSTILYRLLAVHPELCWVSRLTDRFPRAPMLSVAHRLLDTPGIGALLKRRIVRRGASWLTPVEGVQVFERHVRLRGDRRSTEADYDPSTQARMHAALAGHVTGSGKLRFVCKRTANTQRIRLLDRMYPDALFLHLIRDGRAVAHSLTRVPWWDEVDIWWLGQRPPEWRAAGRADLELTALHWRHDTEETLAAGPLLGRRYREVRYEDLVRDPHGILRSICDYAGYTFPASYAALVPRTLPDMNIKWRQALGTEQERVVFEAAGDLLQSLGYARR
jgi:hypothetical protein